jgi:glycosyltransferase involved in cell wall biosynthesis
MSIRIGYDAKRAFLNTSGLGNYSRGVIEMMARHHHENEYLLYTPSTKNKGIYNNPADTKIRIPEKFFDKTFPSFWRSYGISDQLKKDNIDIYHGLSNELPMNIRKLKTKKIVTIHDLIFLRYPELYKAWDRKVYEKKLRYCCQVADKIVSISEQTKKDIVDFIGTDENKIVTVYQTCNQSFKEIADESVKTLIRSKYKLPNEFLLYVGTIEKRKNLLNIVKSLTLINSAIPLVVVGRPTDYLKDIKGYIEKNNLSSRVLIYHNVSNIELPTFYQMARIFIYPSVFEGFGIPIIEALYSGVPVITSTGSCFAESGGPDSIYVPPDDHEQIAFSIEKLIHDENLCKNMIINGLKYVQNFDEKNIADNLISVYKSMF